LQIRKKNNTLLTALFHLAIGKLLTCTPLLTLLSSEYGDDKVVFYGWDVVDYYYRFFKNFYDAYSWQIRTSYALVVFCLIFMFFLFIMFSIRVQVKRFQTTKTRELDERFAEPFREVMMEFEPLMPSEVEKRCDFHSTQFAKYNPMHFIKLLIKLRQELQEVVYIPNMQVLAMVCGVKAYLEINLNKNRKVFEMMQYLTMLNIRVSEGCLANYVNHRNMNIRHMARMSYMMCSDMEPYRYLVEDLNEPIAAWRTMTLHQLMGWLQACDKRMPNFITLVPRIENGKTAAFVIEEMAYWGSEDEKSKLDTFFTDERYECRSAAFKSVAMLRDSNQEQEMVNTFPMQPEPLRREILRAVYAIKSGKQVDFFGKVYHTTASKETREIALTCLYNYSEESRRLFEHLRFENNERDRTLIDQIDSFNLLNQIRSYN